MPSPLSKRRALSASAHVLAIALASYAGESVAHAQSTPPAAPPASSPSGSSTGPAAGAASPSAPNAGAPAAPPDGTAAPAPSASASTEVKTDANGDPEPEGHRAIFFSGDIGAVHANLGGFSNNLNFDKTAANGVAYGLATGLRLDGLRIGARWRVFDTTEYSLWAVMLTAGYGLRLRPISPVFSINAGYIWDQGLQSGLFRSKLPPNTVLPPDVDVRGFIVGADVNASYWITRFLRLGAFVAFDTYFLDRPQAPAPVSVPPVPTTDPLYTQDGSSIGYAVTLGFRGAFDILF